MAAKFYTDEVKAELARFRLDAPTFDELFREDGEGAIKHIEELLERLEANWIWMIETLNNYRSNPNFRSTRPTKTEGAEQPEKM